MFFNPKCSKCISVADSLVVGHGGMRWRALAWHYMSIVAQGGEVGFISRVHKLEGRSEETMY